MSDFTSNFILFDHGHELQDIVLNGRYIHPETGNAQNFLWAGEFYKDPETMMYDIEKTSIRLNREGYNCYIVMNTISTDLLNDNAKSASDRHIAERNLALIDVDRREDTKRPATQLELEQSEAMAHAIIGLLMAEGFPQPHLVMSGNGYHVYIPLDGWPNNDETKYLVKKFLEHLGELFDTETHKVDTTVHNASRITKMVGTVARKGNESAGRPYRSAKLISEANGAKLSIEKMYEFVPDEPAPKDKLSEPPSLDEATLGGFEEAANQPLLPLKEELRRLEEVLPNFSPDDARGDGTITGNGADWLGVVLACASLGTEAVEIARRWSMKSAKYDADAFDKVVNSYGKNTTNPITIASLYHHVNKTTGKSSSVYLGDIGNAKQFAAMHKGKLMYLRDSHKVLTYDRSIGWQVANSDVPVKAAEEVINVLAKEAANDFALNPTDDNAKKKLAEVRRSTKKNAIDAMIALSKAQDGMSIAASECDSDPHLIGVVNGVIDLKHNQLLSPREDRLVTKRMNVAYDVNAEAPRYEQFLEEILPDPLEREFLNRWNGYCLSASVKEQKLLFLKGTGRNGKTVWLELTKHLLGDYADKIQTEMLMRHKRSAQGASPDLVALQGRRFIYANETSEGKLLDDSRVKDMTGGDTITGRLPYAIEPISFSPTHKLVLAGNHAPIITDDSEGMWRRMILLPFMQKFEGAQCDRDLLTKLKGEASGILNYWLGGYFKWQEYGLGIPPSLTKATMAYRNEQDLVQLWIDECCEVAPEFKEDAGRLRAAFFKWLLDNNTGGISGMVFARKLHERGFVLDGGKRFRKGITLKDVFAAGLY